MYDIFCQDDDSSNIEYLCYLNLVMTVLRVTAQDLKYGDRKIKREALKFLKSKWFSEICDNMSLYPDEVRELIFESKKTSSRNSYE
jgi:hypothetical protein